MGRTSERTLSSGVTGPLVPVGRPSVELNRTGKGCLRAGADSLPGPCAERGPAKPPVQGRSGSPHWIHCLLRVLTSVFIVWWQPGVKDPYGPGTR